MDSRTIGLNLYNFLKLNVYLPTDLKQHHTVFLYRKLDFIGIKTVTSYENGGGGQQLWRHMCIKDLMAQSKGKPLGEHVLIAGPTQYYDIAATFIIQYYYFLILHMEKILQGYVLFTRSVLCPIYTVTSIIICEFPHQFVIAREYMVGL